MKNIILSLTILLSAFNAYGQTSLREGDACFDAGDYTCAVTKYTDAFSRTTGRDKQMVEIKLTRAKFCVEHLRVANQEFESNNYQGAQVEYENVLGSNPKDEFAKERFSKCKNILQSQTLLKEGDNCFDSSNYVCAETKYTDALEWTIDKQTVEMKLTRAKFCAEQIQAANQEFANKNYKVAQRKYQNVLSSNPKDEYAKTQLDKCNEILTPTLSVSSTTLTFPESGGNEQINVNTNMDSYSVNGLPSWCSIKKSEKYFIISSTANRTTTSRTGYFTVTAGEKSVRINVSQEAKVVAKLIIPKQNISFAQYGGTSRVDVITTVGTYSISGLPSWCSIQKGTDFFIVSCSANTTRSLRTDYFSVTAGGTTVKVKVSQEGLSKSSTNSCFNCPKTNNKWGLTAGYIDYDYSEGVLLGLKAEPLFKYGFGLNTGINFEAIFYKLNDIFDGFDGVYAVNIPLHLEYRFNFSKWFNLFLYGGIGLNIKTNASFDYYDLPVTLEYGTGLRIDHVQFNIGKSLYLGDFENIDYFGKSITAYQKLALSVSYMF